jgi:hypothetical protein
MRLCWCANKGDNCVEADDFVVEVGTISPRGIDNTGNNKIEINAIKLAQFKVHGKGKTSNGVQIFHTNTEIRVSKEGKRAMACGFFIRIRRLELVRRENTQCDLTL